MGEFRFRRVDCNDLPMVQEMIMDGLLEARYESIKRDFAAKWKYQATCLTVATAVAFLFPEKAIWIVFYFTSANLLYLAFAFVTFTKFAYQEAADIQAATDPSELYDEFWLVERRDVSKESSKVILGTCALKEPEKALSDEVETFSGNCTELKRLSVNKSARRKGIGMMLIQHAERRATEQGYDAIVLRTADSKVPARRLYKKAGFTMTREFNALIVIVEAKFFVFAKKIG